MSKKYSLKILLEKDMHIFDFDDTLGVTDAQTVVAASEKRRGDDGEVKMRPITNLVDRLDAEGVNAKLPHEVEGGLGDFNDYLAKDQYLTVGPDGIRGAQPVVLDTAAYADWKNRYIGASGKSRMRAVTQANDTSTLKRALGDEYEEGTEVHVADFSPSFTLGNVKPIGDTINLARSQQREGDDVGVITARKGETKLDNFQKKDAVSATNKQDIEKFMNSQGVNLDFAYGAADTGNAVSGIKADLAKSEFIDSDAEDLFFYDDDRSNTEAVFNKLCNDPELEREKPNSTIAVYNAHFDNGLPSSPNKICQTGSVSTFGDILPNELKNESFLRELIRNHLINIMS
tara:strand:- start:125 stop:1156 length:1032 start_codon:yes stop_codon:yes gene_type:complete